MTRATEVFRLPVPRYCAIWLMRSPTSAAAEPSRVAGVPVVALLIQLVPGYVDLLGVDDHDEITRVDVRRVFGLPLSPQRVGDARRQSPEGLTLGVDDVPVAGDLTRFGCVGLHASKRRTKTSAGARL